MRQRASERWQRGRGACYDRGMNTELEALTSDEVTSAKLRLKSILLKLEADTAPDSDGGAKLTKKEVSALALESIGAIGALIVDLVD